MKENFTLEDVIETLITVGDNARADDFVAELLNVSEDKVWEIEDNYDKGD